jgi:hypothetical protein
MCLLCRGAATRNEPITPSLELVEVVRAQLNVDCFGDSVVAVNFLFFDKLLSKISANRQKVLSKTHLDSVDVSRFECRNFGSGIDSMIHGDSGYKIVDVGLHVPTFTKRINIGIIIRKN